MPQDLDHKIARAMNPITVVEFYANLERIHEKYNYQPNCIWNVNEIGCQPSRSDLVKVFAKRNVKDVYKIIQVEEEWLTVFSASNANGEHISNYNIFK